MTTFVVFDLEFTTWPDALEQNWSAPGQFREIVQIGALRLRAEAASDSSDSSDSSVYSVVEEYEALVRPLMNPRLSPYFTELTGIDQESVDREGLPSAEALSDFLAFCEGQSVLSYGNDMVVLGENLGWARARGDEIKSSFLSAGFLNVRPWLNTVAPATAPANVGRLWQVLGLPKPPVSGEEHSALFDCHSFAAALRHLRAAGAALPEAWL
ncbi:exonuclease domain-containing protein [Streptomyces aureoverticillatus]|uniref:exonuclease domain-containing protein n=1 Tax=Streptomyces aureoverticillatus TaxID=66871 RepID=UPI0013DBC4C1|nr:exonuclease domain-containing protein [Streptomyces aureoverticillatus]QIB43580.1 exonuclease [Streptomyces aureoverticillatus]